MRSSTLLAVIVASFVITGAAATGCGGDDGNASSTSSTGGSTSSSSGEDTSTSSSTSSSGTTSTSSSGAVPSIVNVTNESIDVDGLKRGYTLVVPKNYDAAKKYPLVLELHGNGGDGSSFHEGYPMEQASKDEAILAYPTAINSDWDLFDLPADNRDMRFMQVLVDALAAKYSIDKARVFGDGYSNGAFFLNELACRVGFFKAIGNSAGGAPFDDPNGTTACAAVTKMPAIIMHGDQDNGVGVDSGQGTASYWAKVNGCKTTLTATTPAPCKAYDGCPANAPVHYCFISGLAHIWWDQAATTAWAFFKALG